MKAIEMPDIYVILGNCRKKLAFLYLLTVALPMFPKLIFAYWCRASDGRPGFIGCAAVNRLSELSAGFVSHAFTMRAPLAYRLMAFLLLESPLRLEVGLPCRYSNLYCSVLQ